MKIAAITMVHNERTFLPIWLNYYSSQIGFENLFVVDHGSSDKSTDIKGLNIFRIPASPTEERKRAKFISSLHSSLLMEYDCVIYTDVDEFLVADPANWRNLPDLIENTSYPIICGKGVNILHAHDTEPAIDFSRPLLSQRRWGVFDPYFCKPVISRIPLEWEPGFHTCGKQVYFHFELYMFHLKSIDRLESHRTLEKRRANGLSEINRIVGFSNHFLWDPETHDARYFQLSETELQMRNTKDFTFEIDYRQMKIDSRFDQERDWSVAEIHNRFYYCISGNNQSMETT